MTSFENEVQLCNPWAGTPEEYSDSCVFDSDVIVVVVVVLVAGVDDVHWDDAS